MSKHEPESTRVRENGTIVTNSEGNAARKIEALRGIVTRKQYAKVDGATVDLFSASAIVTVYDALNDANKAKFATLPVPAMAKVAFQLIK